MKKTPPESLSPFIRNSLENLPLIEKPKYAPRLPPQEKMFGPLIYPIQELNFALQELYHLEREESDKIPFVELAQTKLEQLKEQIKKLINNKKLEETHPEAQRKIKNFLQDADNYIKRMIDYLDFPLNK